MNVPLGDKKQVSTMMAAVAAAASVPFSFTSTKALWTTLDRARSWPGDMPVTEGITQRAVGIITE